MTNRVSPVVLKTLLDLFEAHSSKAVRASGRRTSLRHLGSCGILAVRGGGLHLGPAPSAITPSRSFINLAAPIVSRRMEYSEGRTVGYTPEQIYSVVANVDQYKDFVPWCKTSRVRKRQNGDVQADLEIGFPPIVERYTSDVTFVPNHQVRAVCTDGTLFSHLETLWRFAPGAKDQPGSCRVDFYVAFEFRSLLHSQLASVFFDEVVKKMVGAFESRAAALYSDQQGAALRRRST